MDQVNAAAAVLVQDYPAPGLDESQIYYRNDAEAFIASAKVRAIPSAILATLHENMDAATRDWLTAQGCTPLLGIAEGLNAIQNAIWWGERHRALVSTSPETLHPVGGGPLRGWTEAESKAFLAAQGLPIPKSRLCSASDMAKAANDLRFPLALKMIGARLAHKTEAGAVALHIADGAALAFATEKMNQAVAAHDPMAVTDLFLIEEMVDKPLVELLVSMRRDTEFGPALTLAAGGILVDILKDSISLLMPTSGDDLRTCIASMRLAPLLCGYRGAGSADMAALIATILDLQSIFLAAPELAEIEINPLFVGTRGTTIVDALIHSHV
jgi:acyl-CoA synthetase (NDP forming)